MLKSMAKQRESQQQQLLSLINEKKTQLERLALRPCIFGDLLGGVSFKNLAKVSLCIRVHFRGSYSTNHQFSQVQNTISVP